MPYYPPSIGGSGSGTVNSGLINQLAYYAANGTTLSGLATANSGVMVTSAGGVPSISSTLPSGLAATNLALTTPILGVPQSGTLTNATGLPISTGLTGAGTGVLTALGVGIGSAGAFVTFNGALGTPSSGTLTSATGLPISTGLTGAGTGVLTALGINVGSAGAFVTFGGALGTPSSGVATNLTGTAASLTAGTVTTNANLTGPIASSGNATSITAQTGTGTTFVMQASPTLTTPTLGVATATSINGNIFTTGTYTLTGQAGKTLTFNGSITLTGTDAQTYTFPTTSATIARTDAGQTFTGTNTFANTILASGNVTGSANITVGNGSQLNWAGSNGILTSSAAGSIQHGAADAASPVAQTVRMQSVVAGNANTAGANATIQGSLSNGNGGGDVLIKTTLSVAASGTQNTAATAITFKGGDQSIIMASTTDATSTSTGALQIAGGVSITKRVFTAGLTASAGLQTAVLCLSSSNEIIADSVACLASSERFKQDIAPSDLGLAAVMAMQPIVYRYAPTGNARFDEAPNQRDIHAGFRAEDLAKIDRRFVAFDADGMVRTSRQETIEASLVKAIQEQNARIDAIERGMIGL